MEQENNAPKVILIDEYQEMLNNQVQQDLTPEEIARREQAKQLIQEIFLLGRANAIKDPIIRDS